MKKVKPSLSWSRGSRRFVVETRCTEAIGAKERSQGRLAGTGGAAGRRFHREGYSMAFCFGTPPGGQAAEDADMSPLKAFEVRFSKPLGVRLKDHQDPRFLLLLTDERVHPSLVGREGSLLRPCPVVQHPQDATRPDSRKFDCFASYPSGHHTTMAWALAPALTSRPGDPVPVPAWLQRGRQPRDLRRTPAVKDAEAGELAAAVFARRGSSDYLAGRGAARGTPSPRNRRCHPGPLDQEKEASVRAEPCYSFSG